MDRFYKKQEELSDLNKLEKGKERQRQVLEKEEQIRTDRELEQKRELAQDTRNTLILTEQKKTLKGFFQTMQASYASAIKNIMPTSTVLTPDPGITDDPLHYHTRYQTLRIPDTLTR